MQAIILAGGKGTRLKPYTTVIPKPLMPLGDLPILEVILRQLKSSGITKVFLAVGYLPQLFEAIFANGEKLGIQIEYSHEKSALGTAGPIAALLPRLDENFLVMNGDVLTTVNYQSFLKGHMESNASASICTYPRDVKIDFGVIESRNGELDKYIEKPTYHYEVSMGINALRKKDVEPHLKIGEYLDMPDLLMKIKNQGKIVRTVKQDCSWLDIGRPEDYALALELFETNQSDFVK
jgi:NDP-mannose synthase